MVTAAAGDDQVAQTAPARESRAADDTAQKSARLCPGRSSQDLGSDEDSVDNRVDKTEADSAYEGEVDELEEEEEEEEEEDDDMDVEETVKPGILKKVRKGSLETRLAQKQIQTLQNSAAGPKGLDFPDGQTSRSTRFFSIVDATGSDSNVDQSESLKKSVNWGACPTRHGDAKKATADRRMAYKRAGSSMRKSRSGSKSYWKGFIKGLVER